MTRILKYAFCTLVMIYGSNAEASYTCRKLLNQEKFTDILDGANGGKVDTFSDFIKKAQISFSYKTKNNTPSNYTLNGAMTPKGSAIAHDTIRSGSLQRDKNNLSNFNIAVDNITMIDSNNCSFDVTLRYSSNRSIKNNGMANNVIIYKRQYDIKLTEVTPLMSPPLPHSDITVITQ